MFKGSTDYIGNGYNEENDAVNKIIETANKNDKTYILAIGAITNVAIAIKLIFIFKIKFQNCFKKHSLTYKKQDDIILI